MKTAFQARRSPSARPLTARARGSDLRLPRDQVGGAGGAIPPGLGHGGLPHRRRANSARIRQENSTYHRKRASTTQTGSFAPSPPRGAESRVAVRSPRPGGAPRRRPDRGLDLRAWPCSRPTRTELGHRRSSGTVGPIGQPRRFPGRSRPRASVPGGGIRRRARPGPLRALRARQRAHCRFPARVDTLSFRFRFLSGSLRAETRAAQPASSSGIQSTFAGV